ncbi:hypothetical protein TNIN_364151 [Trichonephila inaurata madagascariensis]|uniref:Uncharacterized protein n=1 Tax=Trichonephila inaurata madagascariensis TaxID=2747483 RepID=A0A8X6XEV8_9ARAC|nr:hypothetical protein TNIN_364151 [Trichonephila inaurata madagascariensis]
MAAICWVKQKEIVCGLKEFLKLKLAGSYLQGQGWDRGVNRCLFQFGDTTGVFFACVAICCVFLELGFVAACADTTSLIKASTAVGSFVDVKKNRRWGGVFRGRFSGGVIRGVGHVLCRGGLGISCRIRSVVLTEIFKFIASIYVVKSLISECRSAGGGKRRVH